MAGSEAVDAARREICERVLGRFSGKRVLLIGIGGGGDIIGTLPTFFDLRRLGATCFMAGLTWKRKSHDPAARPRRLDEFLHIQPLNRSIGIVSSNTVLQEGIRHIESDVAGLIGAGTAAIDISAGPGQVQADLRELVNHWRIDEILALDVGGDVLCRGPEATLRSPLCDQTLVAALSPLPGTLLGIAGIGADGEIGIEDFHSRFEELSSLGAYRGAIDIGRADIGELRKLLQLGKSECSTYPVAIAEALAAEEIESLRRGLNESRPKIRALLRPTTSVPLRNGRRQAELSNITAFTLFFDLQTVYRTSRFSSLIDLSFTLEQLNGVLRGEGYHTELS